MPRYGSNKPRQLAFYDRGPGPAGYLLPPLVGRPKHALTHRINPEYTLAKRLFNNLYLLGPGPAYGIPYGLKANGKFIGFEYTMRAKFPIIDKTNFVPPPNKYGPTKPEIYSPKAPAFFFGQRTPVFSKIIGPGPKYMLPRAIGPRIPDKLAAAECTLKGSRMPADKPPFSPGPIYDIGKPELIKPKPAAFTMRIKWPLKVEEYLAGPASYLAQLPECPCKVPPKGWHMGVRYNDFTGILRTNCDKPRFDQLE